MNQLPTTITTIIFDYIDDELTLYWKSYFSKNIIINIDPKSYFSHKVLSEIEQGFKEVTLYSGACKECNQNGYKINNPNCTNCYYLVPCIICYWYNDDPFNNYSRCNCNGDKKYISWKEICEFYPGYKKYPRYYDLIHSQEWLDYMELEYSNAY